jgi:hypothetical protein
MDKPLERLLISSLGGSAYQRDLWFHGCALSRNVLMVPDVSQAASITRLFLPKLKRTLSDCEIRVGTVEKPASKVYTGKASVFKNGDLL